MHAVSEQSISTAKNYAATICTATVCTATVL